MEGIYAFLNSNVATMALVEKDTSIKDWNTVNGIGIYSGVDAANSPATGWVTAIVLRDNGNNSYKKVIAFGSNTQRLYTRLMFGDSWGEWKTI